MSNMQCPFCQQKLEETMFARGRVFVSCNNPKCPIMDWGGCSKQIITELIRAKNKLDIAIPLLQEINATCEDNKWADGVYVGLDGHDTRNIAKDVAKGLEEIKGCDNE